MESASYRFERDSTYVYAGQMSVGKNLRRLRNNAGFKHQGRFAERAGFSQQWVSDLENERYEMPDTASLMKLAAAIGCTVDDLLVGVDQTYDAAMVTARLVVPSVQPAPSPHDKSGSLSAQAAALADAVDDVRELANQFIAATAAALAGRQAPVARAAAPRKTKASRTRRG
jgi:transcriptional regulator with XRE-family HTH domain